MSPDIDTTCIAKVGRRLKDGTLLTIVKGYLVDIVERELTQVYLSVLCVPKFNAVIENPQMV